MNVLSKPKEPGEVVPRSPVLSILDLPNEMIEHMLEVKWSYIIGWFSLLDLSNEMIKHMLEVKWSYILVDSPFWIYPLR